MSLRRVPNAFVRIKPLGDISGAEQRRSGHYLAPSRFIPVDWHDVRPMETLSEFRSIELNTKAVRCSRQTQDRTCAALQFRTALHSQLRQFNADPRLQLRSEHWIDFAWALFAEICQSPPSLTSSTTGNLRPPRRVILTRRLFRQPPIAVATPPRRAPSLKPARVRDWILSPTFPKPSQMPCSHLELLVKLPAPMAASPSALRSAIPSQLAALDHQAVHFSAPPGRRSEVSPNFG